MHLLTVLKTGILTFHFITFKKALCTAYVFDTVDGCKVLLPAEVVKVFIFFSTYPCSTRQCDISICCISGLFQNAILFTEIDHIHTDTGSIVWVGG